MGLLGLDLIICPLSNYLEENSFFLGLNQLIFNLGYYEEIFLIIILQWGKATFEKIT